MGLKLSNNAISQLASSITPAETSITLKAGDGSNFPTLVAGDYFPATISKPNGTFEIVKCTARSGDTLTVTRAQESTTALAFDANSLIELRLTASTIEAIDSAAAGAAQKAGEVSFFAMNSAPTGWIKANGAAISRTTYAALFSAIGTTFGTGDGSTTFNVPDMRGYFSRGWADNGSVDSGRAFGSSQQDDFKSHNHASAANGAPNQRPVGGGVWESATAGSVTGSTGGTETRPKNVALLACIKY